MAGPILVRRAVPADAARLGELAGALVRQHHATDPARFLLPEDVESGYAWWLEREMRRDRAIVLVAEQSGQIVGYAYATIDERDYNRLLDDYGELHDVYVDASSRRRGAGRRLLAEALEALEERGVRRMVLSTKIDNEAAQGLFRAAGFRPTMLEMTRTAVKTAAAPSPDPRDGRS